MADREVITLDLGAVSSYALAVECGFKGTKEEWAQLQAESGENAQRAEAAAERSEAAAASVPEDYKQLAQDVGKISEEIEKYNSHDVLWPVAKYVGKESNGVTFSFDGNVCYANGTATAVSFVNIITSTASLPEGFVAGKTYVIKFSSSNSAKLRVAIIPYINGVSGTEKRITADTYYTLPNDATGIVVRFNAVLGETCNNESATIAVLNAETNEKITERLTQAEKVALRNAEDIQRNNAYNHLYGIVPVDKNTGNVSVLWNDGIATINGTPSTNAETFNDYYNNTSALPEWLEAGRRYFARIEKTNKVTLYVIPYKNGVEQQASMLTEDGAFDIPETATGLIVRAKLVQGVTYNNDKFYAEILSAPSNQYLWDVGEAVRYRAGESTTAPMLTLIDDDGNYKFYTDLYPVVLAKKVPIATAAPFGTIGKPGRMTMEQIKDVYANGGDVLPHTFSHWTIEDFDSKTEYDFEEDYRKAKNGYALNGIPCDLLVYSGSSGNLDRAKSAAQRVYSGAINAGGNRTNFAGVDKYALYRYAVTDDAGTSNLNGNDLHNLKNAIDVLKSTGGWAIWMLHTTGEYWGDTMRDNIAAVIDYAREQGVQIVTASHGFKTYCGY